MKTGAIDIRRAVRGDAAAIADVHDEAWRQAYRGILPGAELERMIARRGPAWWDRAIRQRVSILVLGHEGNTAGYVTFGQSRARTLPYRGEIYELYLQPEYQGLGFGSKLFEAAKDALTSQGRRSLVVWALADNDVACAFYERRGGRSVGRSVDRIGDVLLQKVAYGWTPAPRA
ncbi:Ribosomal protein S18 acetylase RimI [Pseudoxanthobacter soli DSM 19599]|uniref:Ribosomal protein S18 acetylase RimI n=1 Tax=Pseudoxanthobacter soli DSM 19599 TaxID=1123029 RepID=A0A1M7ZC17_9HYPH|nr:GNAT family N-acetyltransferase [Pseudoxanthobacter soli]SHO62392.1 Ribosomal protein S18 acetylase RimI [Pseudoxanthobacter soli DSM 19599]